MLKRIFYIPFFAITALAANSGEVGTARIETIGGSASNPVSHIARVKNSNQIQIYVMTTKGKVGEICAVHWAHSNGTSGVYALPEMDFRPLPQQVEIGVTLGIYSSTKDYPAPGGPGTLTTWVECPISGASKPKKTQL
ncbi:hypothetical protein FKG94_07885 [Exilibacterium tricleocarpae]|uniref:Uncharacterized protein n=1 Tax=Exilibacterium tricleocarpae TaxID=2591008 RepID=A0A545TZJ5_9GAMM|nr:hypothetical protein [Exilibacterium tricleocarpae]TQV82638.1 hypothetical protein FKG94_07885 [Exilibacterium tricleocarpae]